MSKLSKSTRSKKSKLDLNRGSSSEDEHIHLRDLTPEPTTSSEAENLPASQQLTDENMTYEDEYVVERIIDIHSSHGKRQYLIKWKGYKDSDNTWEPTENLTHCQDIIKEFHRKKDYIVITAVI